MGSPWIEVQLQFSASIVRIEMDSRRGISGPSLAVAEMTWAEPMWHLDIRGERETSSVLTSSWKGWHGLFSNVRGRTTQNEKKRAKESGHDESVN